MYDHKEYYDIGEVAIYVGFTIFWYFGLILRDNYKNMHRHLGTLVCEYTCLQLAIASYR